MLITYKLLHREAEMQFSLSVRDRNFHTKRQMLQFPEAPLSIAYPHLGIV